MKKEELLDKIAEHLEDFGDVEVLVPESCMRVHINGKHYHIVVDESPAEDAALYINESYTGREPVRHVPDSPLWAMSDEEDGSIEFYTDEQLMELAKTFGWKE